MTADPVTGVRAAPSGSAGSTDLLPLLEDLRSILSAPAEQMKWNAS
ncbi:hypothetical protein [Nocardia sp. BMG51109]|nr:hypothetical protein [Nocardia sp. BMG51109]